MRTSNYSHRRQHGFTLVELLVVIGIIALLISILLPSLQKAREAAKRTACASNMRQIAMGILMYVNDDKGVFPEATLNISDGSRGGNAHYLVMGQPKTFFVEGSQRLLNPWIKPNDSTFQVYRCPSDAPRTEGNALFPGTTYFEIYGSSYAYIAGAVASPALYPPPSNLIPLPYNNWALWGSKISRIRRSSKQVMVAEFEWMWLWGQDNPGIWGPLHENFPHDPNRPLMNLAFVDGHVAFLELHKSPEHYINSDYEFYPR